MCVGRVVAGVRGERLDPWASAGERCTPACQRRSWLGERAELPAEKRHPHVLRHTFATRYYRRHKDLAGLQRLLGHADIRTTMRYVHLVEDLHDNVESAFADGLTIEEDTD